MNNYKYLWYENDQQISITISINIIHTIVNKAHENTYLVSYNSLDPEDGAEQPHQGIDVL